MKKLLSKFKVLVPALVCLLALTMVLFTGCKEDVPAHTHSMTHVEGTAATCTTTGVKEHYHCKLCEKDFLTEEGTEEVSAESLILAIDPENHDYVMANTQFAFAKNEQGEWTCTATTECSRNKEHKLVKTATKVTENVTKEATCEKAGSRTLTATFEDKVYGEQGVVVKTEPISALGHNYGSLVAEVPATCTTNGTKEHYTCSVCHKNFDKNHKEIGNITLPAKHDLSYHAQQDPTCTATGNIEYWSCSVCGKNFSNATGTTEASKITIDKIAHKYTNADGQTNYVYDYENARYVAACTRCNHQDETQTKTSGTEQYPYLANDEATFAVVITKGGYIKLENDITIASPYTISKETHLDLNGKTLKSSKGLFKFTNGSNNSTIVGSRADNSQKGYLKLECDKTDSANENNKIISVFDTYDATQLTITNVDMTSSVWGISIFENSSLTLDNCTLDVEKSNAISTNNLYSASSENGMNVVVRNSTIIARGESAIFIPGYMNLTVENSSITGLTSAIHALMGNINVDATSTLTATKTGFSFRTPQNITEQGSGEPIWDGAALIIRTNFYYNKTDVNEDGTAITSSRYAVGNKLTLNIADWSKVTSASGVKAAVYNWTVKSGHIAKAEEAKLTITDQFVEATQKLADKDNVKFYEFNGTEIKEMSVYTYTYVQEANEEAETPAKTYVTKIIATTKEFDMGETSGMPKAYLFYTAGYENGELQETSTGMYRVIDKDGRVIYASVNDEEGTTPLTFKVNQGNTLSLAVSGNGSETEAWFLFEDMKFGILTRSAEGNTFAEYDCTIGEDGVISVVIDQNTTRKFEIDSSNGSLVEIVGVCYGERNGQKTYYESLQDAVKNAQSGETITLISDIELNSYVVYSNSENTGNTLTLDLGGHKITSDDKLEAMFAVIGGELTIRNGQIVTGNAVLNCITVIGYTETTGEGNTKTYAELHSKLTLEETLSVSSKGSCVYVYGEGAELVTSATLYSEGNYATLTGSGNKEDMIKSVSVIGGRIAHKDSTAIYIPNCKNWNISGGTITGATAVYIKSGTVNITGGDFYATGEYKAFEHRNDGCESTGAALVIEACGYPGGDPKVTITGGNFYFKCGTDNGTQGIEIYNYDGHTVTINTNKGYRTMTVAKKSA